MKKRLIVVLVAIFALCMNGCSKDTPVKTSLEYQELEVYDARNLTWGMSLEQVAAQERNVTVFKTKEGGCYALDVDFAGHKWKLLYRISDQGIRGLTYFRFVKEEDPAQWFSDARSSLTDQYGNEQIFYEDETDSVALWRTDTCDIELHKDDSGYINIDFVPKGEDELAFQVYGRKVEDTTAPKKELEYTVPHGEVLDVHETGDTLIIKTKITPKADNHKTISQNFQNLEDLIINQGCSKYSEIQYWAVADMTDGSESKVVSFTAPESTIKGIKDGSIDVIAYLDEYGYLEDVYILPSLKD